MIKYLIGIIIGALLTAIVLVEVGYRAYDNYNSNIIETASLFYYIGCYEASQPLTEAKLAECKAKQKRIIEGYSSILK